ncbi:MAG: hypothetical protein D6776_05945 [Planctomycetota bacterium]|nr:MAG: hypothetical protein D6776_05945 [Planctomycetota bacterium]
MGKTDKTRPEAAENEQAAEQAVPAPDPATFGQPRLGLAGGVLANVLIVGVLLFALFTNSYGDMSPGTFLAKMFTAPDDLPEAVSSDFYYRSVQEDEWLEWGTFWGFVFAAGVSAFAGWRQWRRCRKLPWFLFGVTLFCVVFAGEEISWGQRLLSYRPPVYFLEHNFQQEFNFHNVIDTSTRKLLLKLIIVGYGVVLPLLGAIRPVRRIFALAGVVAPPVGLVPAFFLAYYAYTVYPWDFSGELAEFMIGFGFLFTAVRTAALFGPREAGGPPQPRRVALTIALAWLLVLGVGIGNAAISRSARAGNADLVRQAKQETEALAQDFLDYARRYRDGDLVTGCGLHKRLYRYMRKYGRTFLRRGRFARLVEQGLPEERAEFFLDPWNNPYWVRHYCDVEDDDPQHPQGRISVFVYSFGPNAKRDSTDFEIRGDDVGTYILRVRPDGAQK